MQDILNIGKFVLSATRSVPHPPANFSCRIDDERHEEQQHPGQFAPQQHYRSGREYQSKKLL